MILTNRCQRPEPFYLFLTGGAGVGKSHLVRTKVQTVNRLFAVNIQEQDSHVLVCAPTGAAAYNISGVTCHSAFLLPLSTKKSDDYIPLSSEKLAMLKDAFSNIKLIIIDEISMVGADTLLTIHRRLCDVMTNSQPFGGMSILCVGDLLQLPPVAQRPVFSDPSDEMAAIYGSLWKNHFQILELTEIQRQKEDQTFADLLNRMRIGEHTESDLEVLNSRHINSPLTNYPAQATHVFAYNKDVKAHNSSMLDTLTSDRYTLPAKDTKDDEQTKKLWMEMFFF